jgi:hypothetical protein
MKKLIWIAAVLLAVSMHAQTTDEEIIKARALDYAEGWYAGDAERMARAVHGDLAKRIVVNGEVKSMTAAQLIDATKRGVGAKTPKEQQIANVKILDVFNNAASVRVEMSGWIDYMHLGKFGDDWKIVNVLWERKKS